MFNFQAPVAVIKEPWRVSGTGGIHQQKIREFEEWRFDEVANT
jgi:hypothetical protein